MPIRPENRGRYPADWKLRRKLILQRANWCCEQCGAHNYDPLPMRCCSVRRASADGEVCTWCSTPVPRVVLTIAHLFDKRPECASLLNLAALCQRCHLALDADDRRAARLARRAHAERDQMTLFPSPAHAALGAPLNAP